MDNRSRAEREAELFAARERAEVHELLGQHAARWTFLVKHWHDTMQGKPLHVWLADNALRLGGVQAALDHAKDYHENSERHIA